MSSHPSYTNHGPRSLKQLQLQLAAELNDAALPPSALLTTVRHALDLLADELPVHGPLLKRVQNEIEIVARPGGILIPQPHGLKPEPRLPLPSAYYQAELHRAEANIRLSLSLGPRLRRAVRKLRTCCVEADLRLEAMRTPKIPLDTEGIESRIAAVGLELRGPIEASTELVSPSVERAIRSELNQLAKTSRVFDTNYTKVQLAIHAQHTPPACSHLPF